MKQEEKGLPPIGRQVSKQRSNKLAKRLYKNNSMKKLNNTGEFSYLKSVNADCSLLAGPMSKTSSSKNLLIPSISLKRNKDLDSSHKSMQITQGKILVSRSQEPTFLHYKGDLKYNLQKASVNSKHLFKKINRNDPINQSKMIPDELLGSNSDNQGCEKAECSPKNKGTKLLKGFKSQTGGIGSEEQNLTPDDFIQLMQEDGSITNEFCYLKKVSHPYDLKIVEFQGKMEQCLGDPSRTIRSSMPPEDQYITISSRGVSYFSKQNSRFVPLDRWKKQALFFTKLMSLQFFSKYRLLKNFAKWKKHIRKTAMKSTTDKLKNQLLIGDKFLRKALLATKHQCFAMESEINYFRFDDAQPVMQFPRFKQSQDRVIHEQFQKKIALVEQNIKENLIINMSSSMREFKQENKISTSGEGKGIPLLIGDEKNLDMPYTKEATLRIQQERFKKFLKLVEFIIVDSKIKMITESAQNIVKKVEQQNQNYQKQVLQSGYKLPFKGKQYIQCQVHLNLDQQNIQLKPTREQINYMFQDVVNKSIIKLCRSHRRVINDDDILEIIYDSNEKVVKQPQTNILKLIIMGDERQEKIVTMLNHTINITYSYLQSFSSRFTDLVDMYFVNMKKLKAINEYSAKDHEIIEQSLLKWKNQLLEINYLSQEHQSAIFLLNLREFKESAIRCVTQCFQKMKRVIPEIFRETAQILLQCLQESLKKIEKKPFGIQSFMQFQSSKNQIVSCLQGYADRLSQINCIWMIMKTYSSGNQMTQISRQQRQINRIQSCLNNLRAKLQQAEMNTKSFQTKAQQQVREMVPKVKQDIYRLYAKIKGCQFGVSSEMGEVSEAIESDNWEFQGIVQDIQKIKRYQSFLSVDQYSDQTISKFSNYFANYQDIWSLLRTLSTSRNSILTRPWTAIDIQQSKKHFEALFSQALKLKKKIANQQSTEEEQFKIQANDIDILSFVFLQAKNMMPLLGAVDCLRDNSLSDKESKEIKAYFEKIGRPQVCAVINPENKQATVKQILQLKISEQLDFLQNVVFRSKKQMQIQNKLVMVNKFWIQSSANNAGKNLSQNFSETYWNVITQLDDKITLINGISEDSQVQSQELKQNISQNKGLLDTLRVLLTEWQIHERYLHYFQPVFQNAYWKSSTKQLKIYTQASSNWTKLMKQCKDYSLKRWASNEKAITTIRENIVLFQQLRKVIEQFLAVKREIFPKFYFLSNEELLHILLQEKDFRSVERHLHKAFTCLKSLEIKQQNSAPVGVYNLISELLPIKFLRVITNPEIEEMFRALEDSIKQSIKSSLRNCVNNFQKDQFNRKQWIKENLLQVLLFVQKSQYTKIVQFDYFGPQAQNISQYLLFQNKQIKQLQLYLKEHCDEAGLQVGKIQTLLFQQIQHRQISQMLLKNSIFQQQSYQWQREIRSYYSVDNLCTRFLVNQIDYGYEFVNPQESYPYLVLSDRQAVDLSMALKLKCLPVIKGRQHLVSNFSKFNAKYYRNILCENNTSEKYILNVCSGALLQGCYVQLQNAQKLQLSQLSVISNFLKQIYSAMNREDKTFNFGLKKNPVNYQSGIMFKLSDNANIDSFSKSIPLNTRSFQFKEVPYSVYVNLMLEIRNKNQSNLGLKIMKIIQIVNQLQGYRIFHFYNLRKLLILERTKQIQNYEKYFVKQILNLITEKIVQKKKILFYKKIIYELFYEQKSIQQISAQSNTQNPKINKERSDFKLIVNYLVQITEKKSICIVAGPTQSGKISAISQAYRQRILSEFQMQTLNTDVICEESLFGCYVNGLWKQGILIRKLKKLAMFKQQWIIFQGSYSEIVKNIIQRLNVSYLQLSNGQIVSLSKQWKFIFSVYNLNLRVNSLPKNVQFISSSKFITNEQSMYLMMLKRIKPHFQGNLQNFNNLSNLCVKSFEKLNNSTTLKGIGFKSDYLKPQNLLRYFINIVDAVLSGVPLQFRTSKEFLKGIQKINIWAICWAICSGLPTSNANKFQKVIFEKISTDIQRSYTISFLKLEFQNPTGSFKKIKNNQVKTVNGEIYLQTADLKSKANFVELMIKGNFPVILTGKTGSGKSKFMQYIQFCLNSGEYTYLPIKLRKRISYEQFKEIMFKKTRISIKQAQKKCFCSTTNKKLVIMIDDFNLLDLHSQIGEFLISCIRDGYYYDVLSNQKIYIHNITFIVAQNQTYETRIDNRFLKYFKPVYIDQIQLKDISDVYKQQLQDLEYSRQIFDACVSLNNFVINLQSNGQIKSQYVISQKNSLRIMKCIKQYGNKGQSLPKIWAYVSRLEYTGFSVSQQVERKIQKQIKNLNNLIIQNSNEKPTHVAYLPELLKQLTNKNKLIKSDSQFQEYYQYLSFLISLSQPHNLLSVGQPLPQVAKSQILQYVAEVNSLKFHYVGDIQTLRSIDFKNSLIYLSAMVQENLQRMIGHIYSNPQCKQGRYVLDCPNQEYLAKLMKCTPSLCILFHIFTKNPSGSKPLVDQKYKEYLNKLQGFLGIKINQRQYFLIISNLLSKQGYIREIVQKKKSNIDSFIKKYKQLNEDIQKNNRVIEEFNQLKNKLQLQEETMSMRKKQANDSLSNKKSEKTQGQEDENKRKQRIRELQNEITQLQKGLKLTKAKRKQASQKCQITQNITNKSKQVYKKLQGHFYQFSSAGKNILIVQQMLHLVTVLLSLQYYGIRTNNQSYSQFVDEQIKENKIDIGFVMNVIFDLNLEKINRGILVWVLQKKSILVRDKNNRFYRQIQKAFKKLRVYTQVNSLIYDMGTRQPKIFIGKYDARISTVPQCTYIFKQDIPQVPTELNDKIVITIEDDQQNQKQTIKQLIYQHRQIDAVHQIQNLNQQKFRLVSHSWAGKDRIVQLFLREKQLSLNVLNEIKKQCSILNSTEDRIKTLCASLFNIQSELGRRYQPVIQVCYLFKSYISTVKHKFDYFFYNDQRFEKLIIQSSVKNVYTERSKRKLNQSNQVSKKTLKSIRTKKVLQTQKSLDVQRLQTQNRSNENPAQTQKRNPGQSQAQIQIKQVSLSNSEINIQVLKSILVQQLLSRIFIGLKSSDALTAYSILAGLSIEHKFGFHSQHRECLMKFFNEQPCPKQYLEGLESQLQRQMQLVPEQNQQQTKINQISNSLKSIYASLKATNASVCEKIINFGDICLGVSFEEMITQKYDSHVLNGKQNIVVISNSYQNPFQVLQKNILNESKEVGDATWCYILQDQADSQKIKQMAQKSSISWFVLINNKNPLLFQQIKRSHSQKHLHLIFLYTQQHKFRQLRSKLGVQNRRHMQQLTLLYAEQTTFIYKKMGSLYLNNLFKYASLKPQIQQLSRIVYYQEVNEILRDLFLNQEDNRGLNKTQKSYNRPPIYNQFYLTKAVIQIMNSLNQVKLNNFIKFLFNVCYPHQKQRQTVILKQAKKILSKRQDLTTVFIDLLCKEYNFSEEINFDGAAFVAQNSKIINENLAFSTPQQIVSMFVPQQFRKRFALDSLYFWKANEQQQEARVQNDTVPKANINRENILQNIDKALNELPSLTNLQYLTGKKQKLYYKQLLKSQIKGKLSIIKKIEQSLKKYKKLVQVFRVLSQKTEEELGNLSKHVLAGCSVNQMLVEKQKVKAIQIYASKLESSILYLDKFYQGVQNQKIFQPQHFSDPARFLKYYLYEVNTHVNFKNGEIQARQLTQKDKEIHFDGSIECKSLILTQVNVKGAKFDANKNTLQSNDKNDPSKILNVHICFNNKEIQNLTSSLPIMFHNQKVINISIINKIKDDSMWKDKVELQVLQASDRT